MFIYIRLSELKLQLQFSFEIDDSTEEQADPDTPVVHVPDQLEPPANTKQLETINENSPAASAPSSPIDVILNTNYPLSEELRNLRRETRK